MSRCLELANNGRCTAPPNPTVGAVIVYRDRIIGEGYHIRCGQAHAEVNAIRSVKKEDRSLLREAVIYVSLEPCSHCGRTPPCADLIIETGISRVVIGCTDPFPAVCGKGIRKLRDAGIDVTVGVLEQECRRQIDRFATFHIRRRPYVLLKWAESVDGFIGKECHDRKPIVLSSELTQMVAHKRRAEYAAILVGRETARIDNPSLTTRYWFGKNPVRLVIDKDLTLPADYRLFDGKAPTVVFTTKSTLPILPRTKFVTLNFSEDILPQIMKFLYQEGLQSLMVEGGRILLQSFIRADLWDEAFVEECPVKLKNGVPAPDLPRTALEENLPFLGRNIKHYRNTPAVCTRNVSVWVPNPVV